MTLGTTFQFGGHFPDLINSTPAIALAGLDKAEIVDDNESEVGIFSYRPCNQSANIDRRDPASVINDQGQFRHLVASAGQGSIFRFAEPALFDATEMDARMH